MRRRNLLLTAIPLSLLSGCGLPRQFDLQIAEEVKLHDGSILMLETKVQFQRTNLFSKYENALRRVTTLTFDSGQPSGVVKFTTWLHPVFLDRIAGKWYLVLAGQGPFGKTDESANAWGHSFTTREQRLAILEGGSFHPIAWELAPPSIRRENLFPLVDTAVLAKLDGKKVSIEEKELLLQDPQLNSYRRQITRPQAVITKTQ